MALFGVSSETTRSYWSENARRKILHRYPQGKAPLTYLLSLMDGKEETDKPRFGWWEERESVIKTLTATSGSMGGGGAGPFADAAGTTSSAAAGFTFTAGTVYTLFVDDPTKFRVFDNVRIHNVPNGAASANLILSGNVTSIGTTSITIRSLETVASVSNDTDANDIRVYFYGSSAPEGNRSTVGGMTLPVLVENYTQIHRSTVGPFSRTSLKQGLRFDKSGEYKETLHKESLRHMKGLELSILKGVRSVQTVTNSEGLSVPLYNSGGIEWFCKQWDKQNVANGGAFDYVTGATDLTSADWRLDSGRDKRFIEINGSVTIDELDRLFANALLYTDDTGFKKVILCGSGFYTMVQRWVKIQSFAIRKLSSKEAFGMNCVMIETPWGDLPLKVHPLLNEDVLYNWDAYILDLGNLHWRPLTDSDTQLLTNRQNNDEDGRKDEWLTEGGYEIWNPETHMVIKGLTGVTY